MPLKAVLKRVGVNFRVRPRPRGFDMDAEPAFTELYDYKTDPLETRNIVGNPEQAKRIAAYEKKLQKNIAEISTCAVSNQ